jgi:hypothetical protein
VPSGIVSAGAAGTTFEDTSSDVLADATSSVPVLVFAVVEEVMLPLDAVLQPLSNTNINIK